MPVRAITHTTVCNYRKISGVAACSPPLRRSVAALKAHNMAKYLEIAWKSAFRVISREIVTSPAYAPSEDNYDGRTFSFRRFPPPSSANMFIPPFPLYTKRVCARARARARRRFYLLPRRGKGKEGGASTWERKSINVSVRYSFREIFFRPRQTGKETAIVAFQRAAPANLIIRKSSRRHWEKEKKKKKKKVEGENPGHFSKWSAAYLSPPRILLSSFHGLFRRLQKCYTLHS